jgi:hypothetical protein
MNFGQIHHACSKGYLGLRMIKFRKHLSEKLYHEMLAIQRIRPHSIWSSKAPDICEYISKGQTAALAGRFNENY